LQKHQRCYLIAPMKKPTRTPLTETQLEDAARLRAVYQLRVKESKERGDKPTLNQAEVGERCEWKSPQSMVSQYMNGHVALNLEALVKLANALDFEPAEVSPTLAGGITRANESLAHAGTKVSAEVSESSTPFPAGWDAEAADDKYAHIPQLTARAAAGLGAENPHVESNTTLAFKRDWLKSKGVKADNLLVIYAEGDSMSPTIDDHDVLLVDKSRVEPTDGHVFVLTSSDKGAIVKRLVQGPLGRWIIRSDNADEYPDLMLSRSEVNEHRIIGRVIWRGGDL
jgi:phage repressor protein C with HTH and peptisase S24 domain